MKKKALLMAAGAVIVFAAGYIVHMLVASEPTTEKPASAAKTDETVPDPGPPVPVVWTCSMDPQIQRHAPGKCPICGMDLIPLEPMGDVGARVVPAERKFVTVEVRLVGKVDYDETRFGYITAWLPGRLDRLYVDYTGVPVKKGDHMVLLYSPQLLAAQEELLQAIRAVKEIENSRIEIMKENARATVEAAREKLRLWGLSKEQIAEIERRGKVREHMEINAPMGGIVIHKNAQQGMYVDTGTRIYTIADLSRVWVKLDAYESDLKWLRYGQKVSFTAEAYPGETFEGQIAFIDPVVDAVTRTVKMRVNVSNADGRLKPEMFVRGVVRTQVAAGGRVMDPDLAGKWICYMHPWIVKDGPGMCDVCGMPLVTTESLGYVPVVAEQRVKPLVIPASAPLITGKRAIVYVQLRGLEVPTYEPRVVTLGPRAGDYYVVQQGLGEGDLVVVEGNFKIDAARQLMRQPSMMSPEGLETTAAKPVAGGPRLEVPDAFRTQLGTVLAAYGKTASALAADDLDAAKRAARDTRTALDAVDMKLLTGDAHAAWMKSLKDLDTSLDGMTQAADIETLRKHFALLSESLASAVRAFGVLPAAPVYVLHCPMAFNNRGADWLSDAKEVRNPYFGAAMPKCGEVIETLGPVRAEGDVPHE